MQSATISPERRRAGRLQRSRVDGGSDRDDVEAGDNGEDGNGSDSLGNRGEAEEARSRRAARSSPSGSDEKKASPRARAPRVKTANKPKAKSGAKSKSASRGSRQAKDATESDDDLPIKDRSRREPTGNASSIYHKTRSHKRHDMMYVSESGRATGPFVWPKLRVKPSEQGINGRPAGLGVFAAVALAAGTRIWYEGNKVDAAEVARLELAGKHRYLMRVGPPKGKKASSKTDMYLNSDPKLNPYKGVGGDGRFIGALINESGHGAPNARFARYDGKLRVILNERVLAGDEITVYYGDDFDREYDCYNSSGVKVKARSIDRRKHTERKLAELMARLTLERSSRRGRRGGGDDGGDDNADDDDVDVDVDVAAVDDGRGDGDRDVDGGEGAESGKQAGRGRGRGRGRTGGRDRGRVDAVGEEAKYAENDNGAEDRDDESDQRRAARPNRLGRGGAGGGGGRRQHRDVGRNDVAERDDENDDDDDDDDLSFPRQRILAPRM